MQKNKKGIKIIASVMIFALTMTYLSTITKVVAASLESQTTLTNNVNVEFDAYLIENEQKTHSAIKNIAGENYICTTVTVKNTGYLKDASISVDNANFKFVTTAAKDEVTKIEDSKVYYNQIKAQNSVNVAIPIQMITDELIAENQFNKENVIKFNAIYVDGNGKENKIQKDIKLNLAWTEQKEAELDVGILKFIPAKVNGENVVILQTLIDSYLKDNKLPVKEDKIEISVPSINNVIPSDIKVMANTTKATNADSEKFSNDNYSYNPETNKLTIDIKNKENEEGKITWSKQAKDEFIVTYIYKQEFTAPVDLVLTANSELTVCGENQVKLTKNFEGKLNIQEKIGNLVNFEVVTTTEGIGKGQIYANYQSALKKETEYTEIISANVTLAQIGETNLTDKIKLEAIADNFVREDLAKGSTTVAGSNYAYYKSLSFNKTVVEKILGENGEINIYTSENAINPTIKINSETPADEMGNVIVNLKEMDINYLRIETTAPISEGKLTFNLVKALKGDIAYSSKQMQEFVKLEMNALGRIEGQVEETNELKTEIPFIEPETQIELAVDNTNLSTVIKNENVKINSILKTDTIYTNLFKNPTLEITIPADVEVFDLKNIEVLFDKEDSKLTLKNYELLLNADGTKTLKLELEGIQTEYSLGAISKGVNVVVTADIATNILTPTKQEQIKLVCTNEMTNEQKEAFVDINFVAPTGVVTTNSISNYADNAAPITVINKETTTASIGRAAEAREVNFSMNVINNYNNTIDNVQILGRTTAAQNKDITTTKDLENTMTAPLTSAVNVTNIDNNNVKVYYSENGAATKELTDASNGWTLTPASINNVKSYLIVLDNVTMPTGSMINFNYNAQIPANLDYNATAYEQYAVYYNNNTEAGAVANKEASALLGISTGISATLEATLKSDVPETTILKAGDFIKYTLDIKNTGSYLAENVKAIIPIPENTAYVKYEDPNSSIYTVQYSTKELNFDIGNIEVGKSAKAEFTVVASNITERDIETKTILAQATVTATNMLENLTTNIVKNTIKKKYLDIYTSTATNGEENLIEGDGFRFAIRPAALSKDATNVEVTTKIPEGIKYEKAEIEYYDAQSDEMKTVSDGITYNESTRTLSIKLTKLEVNQNITILVYSTVEGLKENEYSKTIESIATISADNVETESSRPIKDTIVKENFEISQTCTIPENTKLTAGEEFSYKISVKNTGGKNTTCVQVTDMLPEEVQYISTTYNVNGEPTTTSGVGLDNKVTVYVNVDKGKEEIVTINVRAKDLEEDTKITNTVKGETTKIGEKNANTLTHIIEAANYDGKGDNPTITRKISGQIWIDENKNGMRDEQEKNLSGVQVMLYNNDTNKIYTDKTTTTGNDGSYTFRYVSEGNYTVIYLYNSAAYSATTYRKQGVDETVNSDGVDTNIILDGVTRQAAITETITITDSNVYNIDLGLVENPKFDLKLNKTISKITVQDSTGTNIYDYNDAKIAKRELVGKQISNTTLLIEYNISVTNEGAIAGYAKKITDYMPSELKFNSELNQDWYSGTKGELYNASLANTLIKPGETKTITLTLTKKMSDSSLGIYHNEAEISETYNDLGISDIDSIVSNKNANEDDFSSADLVISVKTGEYLLFVGLTITILTVIGVGAYFIKKKVIR